MIRAILGEAALFLLPFAAFALFLVVTRRNPLQWASWSEQTAWLVITGLALAVGALVVSGLVGERSTGAYEPAHMEDGRLVPGRFR